MSVGCTVKIKYTKVNLVHILSIFESIHDVHLHPYINEHVNESLLELIIQRTVHISCSVRQTCPHELDGK